MEYSENATLKRTRTVVYDCLFIQQTYSYFLHGLLKCKIYECSLHLFDAESETFATIKIVNLLFKVNLTISTIVKCSSCLYRALGIWLWSTQKPSFMTLGADLLKVDQNNLSMVRPTCQNWKHYLSPIACCTFLSTYYVNGNVDWVFPWQAFVFADCLKVLCSFKSSLL